MTIKLNSYLSFDGDAKEAIEFYQTVFGGEVHTDTFEKFADSMPVGEAEKDKIMHGYLKGDNGIEIMVADTPTGMEFNTGSQISMTLNGDDEATLRGYWDTLSQGGTILEPLEKAPWGDTFGMLTDKFGINWMVNIGPVQS